MKFKNVFLRMHPFSYHVLTVFTALVFCINPVTTLAQPTTPQGLPVLMQLSPDIIHKITSQNGQQPAIVHFVNASSHPVTVYWIDYAGKLVVYNHLSPGQSYVQQTYLTHPWIIRDDKTGTYPMGFVPGERESVAYIDGF